MLTSPNSHARSNRSTNVAATTFDNTTPDTRRRAGRALGYGIAALSTICAARAHDLRAGLTSMPTSHTPTPPSEDPISCAQPSQLSCAARSSTIAPDRAYPDRAHPRPLAHVLDRPKRSFRSGVSLAVPHAHSQDAVPRVHPVFWARRRALEVCRVVAAAARAQTSPNGLPPCPVSTPPRTHHPGVHYDSYSLSFGIPGTKRARAAPAFHAQRSARSRRLTPTSTPAPLHALKACGGIPSTFSGCPACAQLELRARTLPCSQPRARPLPSRHDHDPASIRPPRILRACGGALSTFCIPEARTPNPQPLERGARSSAACILSRRRRPSTSQAPAPARCHNARGVVLDVSEPPRTPYDGARSRTRAAFAIAPATLPLHHHSPHQLDVEPAPPRWHTRPPTRSNHGLQQTGFNAARLLRRRTYTTPGTTTTVFHCRLASPVLNARAPLPPSTLSAQIAPAAPPPQPAHHPPPHALITCWGTPSRSQSRLGRPTAPKSRDRAACADSRSHPHPPPYRDTRPKVEPPRVHKTCGGTVSSLNCRDETCRDERSPTTRSSRHRAQPLLPQSDHSHPTSTTRPLEKDAGALPASFPATPYQLPHPAPKNACHRVFARPGPSHRHSVLPQLTSAPLHSEPAPSTLNYPPSSICFVAACSIAHALPTRPHVALAFLSSTRPPAITRVLVIPGAAYTWIVQVAR
ncbi:hypothetical protein FIBSPDRAFT_1037882 [Athelia psychrophila]|uniref:Uncharacterized protein n=1 Tax=Athelia psychrophila TaxID=1759441 RepID=A0A166TTM7_9AGAM|nr:hypothetical protein FIBSPDRAFT_1037882 [Fibularhizoctonia sp. CBS 109695]